MPEDVSHSGSSESSGSAAAPETGLRPPPGLEIIEGRDFLAENVEISGRHFIRC